MCCTVKEVRIQLNNTASGLRYRYGLSVGDSATRRLSIYACFTMRRAERGGVFYLSCENWTVEIKATCRSTFRLDLGFIDW